MSIRNLDASQDAPEGDARLERRKLIKAAIASAPIVLTITAGRARAQDMGSIIDSQMESDTGEDEPAQEGLLGDEELGGSPAQEASEFSSDELQILQGGEEGIE
jgi:hypothetical protein